MNIVLDTNVLVAGLLSPFQSPAEIVRMVSAGILKLCYDARILCEYREVLLREKFRFDKIYVEDLIDQIESAGILTAPKPLSKRLPDPDDEPFLEAAIAGKVRFLITGNLKHYPLSKQEDVKIVSPARFVEIFRAENGGVM
ncbi:MAG: putative toxin-antitoxin system toxin component, PIN family [Candidatus Omnitrophota bacterium]